MLPDHSLCALRVCRCFLPLLSLAALGNPDRCFVGPFVRLEHLADGFPIGILGVPSGAFGLSPASISDSLHLEVF